MDTNFFDEKIYNPEVGGSGCTLGTTIAAFLAEPKDDKLLATSAGMLLFEIAAEPYLPRPCFVSLYDWSLCPKPRMAQPRFRDPVC
ncbi:hypothetical protein MMC12_007763 [Toensbergia leucococca]|nr:hypothetical protein [Toensbergia leucococca]